MASPPAHRRRARTRRQTAPLSRRGGRAAIVVLFGIGLLVILLLAAFGSSTPSFQSSLPNGASALLASGRPLPQIVAFQDALRIHLPIPQDAVSALGYHASGDDSLPLKPVGRQANEGLVSRVFHRIFGSEGGGITYYQLGGDRGQSTAALDVGAATGTDVYAPVDGTIVTIDDLVLDGRRYGSAIELQPADAPSVIVRVSRLRADPSLTIGSRVTAATSKIGSVVDLAATQEQALAKFTHDAGNHVTLEVLQTATLSVG